MMQYCPYPQEGEEEGGNIYTGATPPWLMEEEDGDDKTVIGPTLHIFNKHCEPWGGAATL